MKQHSIDINCDMGESTGNVIVGNDAALFPFITSCNIACGAHAGDEYHMERTIKSAILHGVRIGAHPSYLDRKGFGRRAMNYSSSELRQIIIEQVMLLKSMTERLGGVLSYVKPHGALYNSIASNANEARIVYNAVKEIDSSLSVMGLAGSDAEVIAKELNIDFISEAFADRKYLATGSLMSRSEEGAVISNPEIAATQVLSILLQGKIEIDAHTIIPIFADSICIHGDNPNAVEILAEIHNALIERGITLNSHPS